MTYSAPEHINWNFTDICNFNCRHCYSRGRPKKEELNEGELFEICDKIVQAGVFAVNFGGGAAIPAINATLIV